jgi:Protein of unknown function (DUF3179)
MVSTEWLLHRLGVGRFFWRETHLEGKIAPLSLRFYLQNTRPLFDPRVVPAAEATHMTDDDIVLGLVFDDQARAYPWWIMDNHHVANDVLGGQALVIVFCEMCSTGVAFDPTVNGRRLTFEHRRLYNGTIAFDDLETGSVWSPYLQEAIRGKLAGTRLRLLPLRQIKWKDWKEMYPATTVVAGGLGSRTGHGSRHSIGSPEMGPRFRSRLARWDSRLPHNTLVLGVTGLDTQRAYPLDTLQERDGVVNDDLDGVPIVIFAPPLEGNYAALAFSRAVDGRVLTFRATPDGPVDVESESRWTWAGEAEAGPHAGTSLSFVDSHISEWFVWPAHYPDIEIYQLDHPRP